MACGGRAHLARLAGARDPALVEAKRGERLGQLAEVELHQRRDVVDVDILHGMQVEAGRVLVERRFELPDLWGAIRSSV